MTGKIETDGKNCLMESNSDGIGKICRCDQTAYRIFLAIIGNSFGSVKLSRLLDD